MQRRAIVLCGAALALPVRAQAPAPGVVWRLASGYRAESFHTENLRAFAQAVGSATAGALRIDVQPDNRLEPLARIFGAVREGRIEAGETIMTSLSAELPIAGADAVPFVVASYADAQRLWTLQRPLIQRQFAALGLVPLYAVPWPPQGLYSHRPVSDASDFRGTRMRTYNPTTVRIAELLGAEAVDVPMVQVGEALRSGRVDSMITSAVTGVESAVWEHIGHYHEINAWFPKNIVFVRRQAFDALDARQQAAVRNAAAEAEARGWRLSEAVAASSTQTLRDKGMTVSRVPARVDTVLKRLGEKFSREWVRSVGHEANEIFVPYYLQSPR
jgi:TRAP-type C4-dicarboxylate transport system substrate-binding protein